MKKIFVSVPFAGRTSTEIYREIQLLENKYMKEHGYTIEDIKNHNLHFANNLWYDPYDDDENDLDSINSETCEKLLCLSNALNQMAYCDDVIFSENWETTRGCRIEHLVYELYMKESS